MIEEVLPFGKGTVGNKGCKDGLQMADEDWEKNQILGILLGWKLFISHPILEFVLYCK
jgi:hypothetical protein